MQKEDSNSNKVVCIKDLSLVYKGERSNVVAVEDINLDIHKGEFICVLGPSGCGKSTLLNIIAGFINPTSGAALMRGKPIEKPALERGVVFQNSTLYPWLNIYQNISFGLKMQNFDKDTIKRKVTKYLELVGLSGFEKHKPYELSGGMRQRASLARALVNKPEMLLMDEPFAALDALTRENMQNLTREIWKKQHNTIFLITHDVNEALCLATKIVVMSSRPGKIEKEYDVDFTHKINAKNKQEIAYSDDYIKVQKDIIEIISKQNKYLEDIDLPN